MENNVSKAKGTKAKGGKKNRKYDRHKRGASNQMQAYRSAANKQRKIAKEAKRQASPKRLAVAHGQARRSRRYGKSRTNEANI